MDEPRETTPESPARSIGPVPVGLPRVPQLFWSARPEFDTLKLDEESPVGEILESLGSPPFPKTGFPFIGFLATVYDHVVTHACGRRAGG